MVMQSAPSTNWLRLSIVGRFRWLVILASVAMMARSVEGQVGGGGGGGGGAPGGADMPAFSDPKFKDRLYEAGGPRIRKATNGAPIISVKVEGNRSISENFVVSQMQSREDRPFDEETFNRDISALYRTNLFRRIDPYFNETPQGVEIRMVIDERPIVKSVEFIGNERLLDRQLRKHAGIEKGDALDPISINSARGRLIELYQDKGFNQIDVQIRRGLKPGDRDVEFMINEGPLERLKQIKFVGNRAFSSDLLKARIKSRDSRNGLTRWMMNVLSDTKLNADRDGLMNYYRSLGYFDARVDYHKDYNDAGDAVNVTFAISEGARYSVGSVSIVGVQLYRPEELISYMKLKENDPFLQAHKSADEKFLRDLYGAQGHIFSDIVGELVYQPNNTVDVVYNVAEGDVYRASEINVHIEGDHTRRHVVLQPLGKLRPGSKIDLRDVESGERRLRFGTIFNNDPSQGETPHIDIKPPESQNFGKRF